ncbi:hypothetical protein ACUHGC_02005 [Testudinibacter sp. P27/CKL/0425]
MTFFQILDKKPQNTLSNQNKYTIFAYNSTQIGLSAVCHRTFIFIDGYGKNSI